MYRARYSKSLPTVEKQIGGGNFLADVDTHRRHQLGQFLTPRPVADFMASLLHAPSREIHLLDAGAGGGALTAAVVRQISARRQRPRRFSVTAYELDPGMIGPLRHVLGKCGQECDRTGIQFEARLLNEDFVTAAVELIRGGFFASPVPNFNLAIVNPPYRKIRTDSPWRLRLQSVGIETSNLYAGFLALIIRLLAKGGTRSNHAAQLLQWALLQAFSPRLSRHDVAPSPARFRVTLGRFQWRCRPARKCHCPRNQGQHPP